MNTTYFLNLVSGNVFGSQKTPAIPTKYYLGLSSAAPNLDGSGVVEPEEGTGYARVELTSLSRSAQRCCDQYCRNRFCREYGRMGDYDAFCNL